MTEIGSFVFHSRAVFDSQEIQASDTFQVYSAPYIPPPTVGVTRVVTPPPEVLPPAVPPTPPPPKFALPPQLLPLILPPTTPYVPSPQIELTSSITPNVIKPNDEVTITITVYNQGDETSRSTVLENILPEGFTYLPGTMTIDGVRIEPIDKEPLPKMIFTLGDIPPGSYRTIAFKAIATSAIPGMATNQLRVVGYYAAGEIKSLSSDTVIVKSVAAPLATKKAQISSAILFTTILTLLSVILPMRRKRLVIEPKSYHEFLTNQKLRFPSDIYVPLNEIDKCENPEELLMAIKSEIILPVPTENGILLKQLMEKEGLTEMEAETIITALEMGCPVYLARDDATNVAKSFGLRVWKQ